MKKLNKDRIHAFLDKGVRDGVFPGAVLLVAQGGKVILFKEAGYRLLNPHPGAMHKDTIFDLASLTKPLATTLAIMKMVDKGEIYLDQPIYSLLPLPLSGNKRAVTLRLLLSHSAGFIAWRPFYLKLEHINFSRRKDMLREHILNSPLSYQPGDATLYSDTGFMVLEWIIEERTGMSLPSFLERHFFKPLCLKKTFLSGIACPSSFPEDQFAATETCPWRKKTVIGYVHDENAYSLGGFSGHAGLFGTAEDVYSLVNLLRMHFRKERDDYLKPETVSAFFTRQNLVKGSTWALGWDTPSPQNSSSGRYLSANSVGHLGFTGTSVWVDLDKDIIIILLTNRIHPTRNNEKIRTFRPEIHNLIMEGLRS